MARIITEKRLMEKCISFLPKELKGINVIEEVEVDGFGNSGRADGISYWVYLRTHYITEYGHGCHTIHEDNLKQIKYEMEKIVYVAEDTE